MDYCVFLLFFAIVINILLLLRSISFPYTTLFRSAGRRTPARRPRRCPAPAGRARRTSPGSWWPRCLPFVGGAERVHGLTMRSEEHTSELQSPCNLVCRLLLEKNNS